MSVTRPLAFADVEIDGVSRPVVVTLADDGAAPLIGLTTLENLRFKVNALEGRLEPATAIEY